MRPDELAARLRAAGCVFAEEEAALLREAAGTGAVAAGDATEATGGSEATGALEALVARRVAGEPLETVLGWVAFAGLRLRVAPGVFVPRRRTEHLAALAVASAAGVGAGRAPVVVELCCGVAPVAAAAVARLAAADRQPEVLAVDIDAAAVACAHANLDGGGRVLRGDLDAPLPAELRGRVDVWVANAPYVPSEAIALMPPEAREHEPRVSLDGGTDGLSVARGVVAAAPGWLAPAGVVLVETSERQALALASAVEAAGLVADVVRDEERDATVVRGLRPS